MAKDPGGKKRILLMAPDGKRKVIRLGKMPLAQARNVKYKNTVNPEFYAGMQGCTNGQADVA